MISVRFVYLTGQRRSLFRNVRLAGSWAGWTDTPMVEVPAEDGCPAFLAYGSVLDNASGDATTLEPQYRKELSPEAIEEIYPSGAGKAPMRRAVRVK